MAKRYMVTIASENNLKNYGMIKASTEYNAVIKAIGYWANDEMTKEPIKDIKVETEEFD
jgi:hypothetical protein